MEALLQDILIIAPLHITNDLVFLIMRWQLLGKIHLKDRPVSKRLFGKNKSWLGMAIILASNMALYLLFTGKLLVFPAIGAAIGVHANSFIKRRLDIPEGNSLPILDQLDFVIGGIAGLALSGIYLSNLWLMLAFSFALHIMSNVVAYLFGMKEKPL